MGFRVDVNGEVKLFENSNKNWGRGSGRGGVRRDVNGEVKLFLKIQKKMCGGGGVGSGGGGGGQGRCEWRSEAV